MRISSSSSSFLFFLLSKLPHTAIHVTFHLHIANTAPLRPFKLQPLVTPSYTLQATHISMTQNSKKIAIHIPQNYYFGGGGGWDILYSHLQIPIMLRSRQHSLNDTALPILSAERYKEKTKKILKWKLGSSEKTEVS